MIQLETRSEKLSPSILTRGSSQSEEGRGRIEKNLFSARELSPHLRNCDKFTSAQKEPIRARHNARLRAQPREKRQTQRKLIDVNVWLQISACNTHCGTSQNTKCKQTQNTKKGRNYDCYKCIALYYCKSLLIRCNK